MCNLRSIAQHYAIDRTYKGNETESKISSVRSITWYRAINRTTHINGYIPHSNQNATAILSMWTMRSIAWYRAIDRTPYTNGYIVPHGAIDPQAWCDRSQGLKQP